MATATYKIEVDWNNDGDFSDSNEDITADVKEVKITRGKDEELGKAGPAILQIRVNNADSKYSPEYSSSPLYGYLLPKRVIKVTTTSPAAYDLFYGYIETIKPHPHLNEQDAFISAVDGLDFLAKHELDTILAKDQLTGYLVKLILDNAGWPNGGIITDNLLFNVPLWHYDLNGSSFKSKDNNQYTLTVTSATWTVEGRSFDASGENIDTDFDLYEAITLCFWAKTNSLSPASARYLCDNSPGSNGFYMAQGSGQDRLYAYVFYTTYGTANTYVTIPDTDWHFYTLVIKNTGIELSIDAGTPATVSISSDTVVDPSDTMVIGNAVSKGAEYWDGVISEGIIYSGELTQSQINHIYNATEWKYGTNIDDGQDTVPFGYWHKVSARTGLGNIEDSELGFIYVNGAGGLCFEDRHHRYSATHQTSQATFNNTMANILYDYSAKKVYNEVRATITPWELKTIAEMWRLEEAAFIPAGETKIFWGNFGYFADEITEPVSTTDYTANTESGGGGTDKTSDISIKTSKFSQSVKLSVTNNAAVGVYMTLLRIRGTYYDNQTKLSRKSEDTTSQSIYQKRTLELDGKYLTDADKAQAYCDYAIARFKDPQPEISIVIVNKSDALLTQILSRKISDRITVQNTLLGLDKDFFINKISHEITHGGLFHKCEWKLVDASNEDFWCLDYSELGTNTKLGY